MMSDEITKLNRQFGAKNVASFVRTFTYAVNDVLRLVQANQVALPSTPAPDPADGGRLVAALYGAGRMANGRFDVGYMIEHAISHRLHVALMHDINADPAFGPKVNANFHTVLTQVVLDLKDGYGL